MKHFIKGMTLLLAGVMVMACSKDVAFDENAQKQAQAEAEIQKKFAEYEVNFINQFGKISSTQDWGFGDEAKGIITRGESNGGYTGDGPYDCGFDVPTSIVIPKNGQAKKAADELNKNNKGYTSTNFVFNNYWVQHFLTPNGANNNMKYIEAWDSSVTPGRWIEIAGFKDGKKEGEQYFKTNTKVHGTTLMTNMGGAPCDDAETYGAAAVGKYFRYMDSEGNLHYDYKFLDFTTNGHTYFLVCFPYEKNKDVNWWIVSIVKAEPTTYPVVEEGRIMCEDLGDTGDFDFNDVVFDARRFSNGVIEITLVAAGGELPITVAGEDVHARMGGTMVNTGVNDGTTYKFTVTGFNSIKAIPVMVYPDGIGNGDEAVKYELNAPVGKVPQKICTPRGSHYSEEYENIKNTYSEFLQWVQNDNPAAYMWVENAALTDLDLQTK